MAGSSNGRTPGYEPGNERFKSSTRNHGESGPLMKGVYSLKFLRLTSVFLCCALLSSFLTLSASAVDDNDYYSLPPVGGSEPSTPSFYPVNPAEFDNSDSQTLTNIYKIIQYLYLSPASWQPDSVIGFLSRILDRIPSNLGTNFALQGGDGTNSILDDIRKWTMFSYNYLSSDNIAGNLGNIQRNTAAIGDFILSSNTLLGSINDAVSGIHGFATENTLSGFDSYFRDYFSYGDSASSSNTSGHRFMYKDFRGGDYFVSLPYLLYAMERTLVWDGNLTTGVPTIYRMLHLLQDTLASEDDRKLAENYKENREQAEKDFLSGKSGKTSLGKDDFGSLSSVGGTFKDAISLNGQSSISDLTSGLSDADTAGQGWFSQATKDSLDAVSSSGSSESTVSTLSDDGLSSVDVDPDPYHMQGFEDNYAWLWGDDDG
jgi:hypothetical protein